MDGSYTDRQHRTKLQCNLAGKTPPFSLSQNNRLFFHDSAFTTADSHLKWSYHFYDYIHKEHGQLPGTCAYPEIPGKTYPICTDLGNVYRTLHIYPKHQSQLKHAWFPGILAGTAFQAFQFFYVNSQIWVSNYNAIYGSFAAIPMFLLWTQISWTICLFGAEMSYVSQNLGSFDFGKESANISRRYHDFFCTIILSAICKSFAEEKTPYSAEEISKQYKIPIRLTKRILYELQDIHLIFETIEEKKGDVRYLPGIDINKLTVGTLLEKLDSAGSEDFKVDRQQYSDSWKILEHARKEYMYNNSQILLKDL